MTNILNIESFIADQIQPDDKAHNEWGWLEGTIEATLHGITKRIDARKVIIEDRTDYTAHSFVVKYRTGGKLWNASVTARSGKNGFYEFITGGFDSRSGKHNLSNAIWFRDDVKSETLMSRR